MHHNYKYWCRASTRKQCKKFSYYQRKITYMSCLCSEASIPCRHGIYASLQRSFCSKFASAFVFKINIEHFGRTLILEMIFLIIKYILFGVAYPIFLLKKVTEALSMCVRPGGCDQRAPEVKPGWVSCLTTTHKTNRLGMLRYSDPIKSVPYNNSNHNLGWPDDASAKNESPAKILCAS